jgi:ribosome biogenesis GTPase A
MGELMAEIPYEKMNIQWFPGHMTKAQRMIEENIKLVDAVCEILDARIPRSSRNPDIDRLAGDKPRLVILNRTDLADPAVTARWRAYFEAQGLSILETDAKSGKGVKDFAPAVRRLLADKLRDYEAKGQVGRPLRVMILGIPNVGKSTFINKVAGRKAAIAGDKPGVTRGKQWINIGTGLDLLDTPGILWPKFEDQQVGIRLALVSAIREELLDINELSLWLLDYLQKEYPGVVQGKYAREGETFPDDLTMVQLLEAIAVSRNLLVKGGEPDYQRTSKMLLDDYKNGRTGRISLENVPVEES